eukprot:5188014-Amphidinium_carterae.1
MEPMARQLEKLLMKHCPQGCWNLECNLCNSPLRTDHIPGKKHCGKAQWRFATQGEEMNWEMPSDDIVRELHRPWVWQIPCEVPAGAFLCFNHLTGESCLEGGSQPAQQQEQQQLQAAVPVQSNMQPPINNVPELGYAEAFEDWGNNNGKFRRFHEPKCQALEALMKKHGVQIPDTCQ